jgi:aspartate 1-decarboxylase
LLKSKSHRAIVTGGDVNYEDSLKTARSAEVLTLEDS